MEFFVEEIPDEARIKYASIINEKLCDRWVISKENNTFMVLTKKYGGPYEGTPEDRFYTLVWRGEQLSIRAAQLNTTFDEQGATMHWRIDSIPIAYKNSKEFIQIVRDAFRAVGKFFNGQRFFNVEVVFNKKIGVEQ